MDATSLVSLEAVVCAASTCLTASFFFTLVFFNELLFFILIVGFLLFFLVGVLSLVTNMYTVIFVIEFINLIVFLLFCLTRVSFLPQPTTRGSLFSGLLVFFWINALASVLFFSFLLINSSCGWVVFSGEATLSCFIICENCVFSYFFLFFVVFIFYFKLGLPPFIF